MGDIALDDLDIVDGPCPPPKFCDFETDMCKWSNIRGDEFDWRRDSGGTPSLGTGPSTDHTTGTRNGLLLGSLFVSGKLCTYPSPKPTLTLTCHLGQNVGLREG